MNLLIVDDEILAIQGLLDDIPWKLLSFDKILTANSYSQAVNLFMQEKIDVLLCDIEMPYGSGIDLVKWVKERYQDTECIFLTCHDDFSFAKQAIMLQCIGYILKPADTKEVMEYLLKAQKKIMDKDESQLYSDYGKVYLEDLKGDIKMKDSQDALIQVEKYIHTHISEPIQIEELADMVYLSMTHLGRLFKKKHNQSMIDYITEQRIQLAKELLKDEKLTISAVAAKSGYNNYSYFTKIFKSATGKTPREYRRKLEK